MKKAFACVLALCILSAPLAGCGEDGDSSSSGAPSLDASSAAASSAATTDLSNVKLGVAIYKFDDTFMVTVRDSIRSAATAKGIAEANLHVSDGLGDQTTQTEQVKNFLAQDVNALIINPVDPAAAQKLVNSAKGKSTPLVFVNRMPEDDIIQSYEKCYYVGPDPRGSGKSIGEIMAQWWLKHPEADKSKDGKMQLVLLIGEIASSEAKARTEYSKKAIEAAGIPIDLLEEDATNWKKSEAVNMMDVWWIKHGEKIEAVIANNDDMALGVLESLQSKGYNTGDMSKFIPIVGIDGTPDGQAAVRAGEMVGTVRENAPAFGKACVAVAFALYEGKAITPANIDGFEVYDKDVNQAATGRYIWVPQVQITQENVGDY